MHWFWIIDWFIHHHLAVQGVWRPGGVSVNPPPVGGPVPIPHRW